MHAQLRGDSIQRDYQDESLVKNDDTGTVANDNVVALYDATIDDVVAFDQVVDADTIGSIRILVRLFDTR